MTAVPFPRPAAATIAEQFDAMDDGEWERFGAVFNDGDAADACAAELDRVSLLWTYRIAAHGLRFVIERKPK